MKVVTREIVLIGSSGKGKEYLHGVERDLSNARAFFTSERGGKFFNSEITSIFNGGLDEVAAAIHNTSADYQIVYFSGHGYTEQPTKRRMLCLPNFSVADTYLLSPCPRQLIIVDACRTFGGASIGAIPSFEDEYDNFTGSPVRGLFDSWIMYSPEGKIIIHATPEGMVSLDSNKGGIFTRTWLETANSYYPFDNSTYVPVDINRVSYDVQETLKNNGSHQQPCIVYNTGSFQVPFAVAKHQLRPNIPLHNTPLPQPVEQIPQDNSLAGLLLIGLVVAGVAVLTS